MTKKEALKYKDYPDGSLSKKTYDSFFMPFREFLEKYYQQPDLSRWDYCNKKFVTPLFDGTSFDEYQAELQKIKPAFSPSQQKLLKFCSKMDDLKFDFELKRFFAFLYSINFYGNISFEEWLKINNWNHPWYVDNDSILKPIEEILRHPFGVNYLKVALADLNIFNQ